MLEEEYKKIMNYFQETLEGKPVNLEEICSEALHFFHAMKEKIANGSEEEKQAGLKMLQEMQQRLATECKKVTEKTGMSEEQLVVFAENPSNFNEEQWRILQETRRDMMKAGLDLAKVMQKGAVAPTTSPSSKEPLAPSEKGRGKKKIVKTKRSSWVRS